MSKKKKVSYDFTPYNEYSNYLKNYDTSNVDTTLSNLTNWASTESTNNLSNMGDYTFNVDGSDEARQRAENAIYSSMLEKMTPQFDRQREDMATMLQNQGIPVGSEAYARAMGDLEEKQNDALTQASYQAVLGGQDAFSQSLADEVNAGGFGNTAQQTYINLLLNALNGSASGYENQQNIFSVGTGKSDLKYAQDKANANASSGLGTAIGTIGGGLIGAYLGGPQGAAVGAKAGGTLGGIF